ncbi:MAG: hypothetical protein M0D57_20600 [Sphingobacteriales bacterium JAD_PAG50586_3]|nr:MAG: hypothetical protein M0D57_20600 [Sphingobacteriales bacterium JAD_PAG50586_3]
MKTQFLKAFLLVGIIAATFTACKKDDDSDDDVTLEQANYVVKGTVNNQAVNITDGYATTGWDGSQTGLLSSNIVFRSKVKPSLSVDVPAVDIRFGDLYYSSNDYTDQDNFYDYFRTGSGQWAYGIDTDGDATERKVDVIFTDANGDVWSSTNGSGSQAGSTFEITEVFKSNKSSGYVLKFRAKLRCNLYNDNGDAIVADITEFIGQVETYE